MKRWKKIGIGVVLSLVVAIAGLAVWQQENLKALYTFLTNDSETISNDMETKRQEQQEVLKDQFNVTVLPPSTEQSNDLLDGKVSPEEVKDQLGITQELAKGPEKDGQPEQKPPDEPKPPEGETASEQSKEPVPEKPPEEPPAAEKDPQKQIDELINQCVAELYACEVDLMARLGAMKQAAVDEWVALSPEERTSDRKLAIGFAGLEQCYELEVEIDQQVKSILGRYEPLLKDLEADITVLDDLWDYYCEKKATQKAYYLDKYLE